MTHQGVKVVKQENNLFSNFWKGLVFLSQCSKVENSHLKQVIDIIIFKAIVNRITNKTAF